MKRQVTCLLAILGATIAANATAQEIRIHGKGATAHAVTTPQSSELGWGGGGALGAELTIGKYAGVQIQTGALGLSQGNPPSDKTLAPRSTGVMFGTTGGVRLNAKGFWIDGGAGVAVTGGEARPLLDTSVGFDFRLGSKSPLLIGPYVGYEQIIADPGALRTEDSRVVLFGIHAVLGSKPKAVVLPPIVEAKKIEKPRPPLRTDRDLDTIYDDEDACPDVPGVRTDDPSTNGCPETQIRMVEDHLVLPDSIHFEFDSPRVRKISYPLLHQIADYLQARGDVTHVQIEGHADEVGTADYNLSLSAARAEEVKKKLIEFGVNIDLATEGYGESKPRDRSHSERARMINRRVEFVVTLQHQVKEEPINGAPHASN
jgi:outer membrane protein OmpA-like peptidoglycan-associated protein